MVPAKARPMVRRERGSPKRGSLGRRTARERRAEQVDVVPAAGAASGKRAHLGRVALLAIVATGLLLGNLALRAAVMSCGYRLVRIEEKLAATETEYDRLSLSIANLDSLERIEEIARVRLGMVDPAAAEFVVLVPGDAGRRATGDSVDAPSPVQSQLKEGLAVRAGDALIGLVSPFVARWFYDIPNQDHPQVRVTAR